VVNKAAVSMFNLAKGTQIAMIPWWLALTGVLGSVILGVAAGYFPARWASKLRPNRRRDKEVKGHKIYRKHKEKARKIQKTEKVVSFRGK